MQDGTYQDAKGESTCKACPDWIDNPKNKHSCIKPDYPVKEDCDNPEFLNNSNLSDTAPGNAKNVPSG